MMLKRSGGMNLRLRRLKDKLRREAGWPMRERRWRRARVGEAEVRFAPSTWWQDQC